MTTLLLCAGYALFVWWFATGLILILDQLPRETHGRSTMAAAALSGAALLGLAWSAGETSIAASLCAFTCALVIWGFNELTFLTGAVTGPRKEASPPGTTGWLRTRHAIEAILWHELALLAGFALILLLTWSGANQTAAWTYAVLWVMRLSAKINIHLGVPNHAEEFLPPHLAYLKSWFTKKPMNPFFPVSVTAATVALALIASAALAPEATPHEQAAYGLVGALLALAILEHWFLVMPFQSIALWRFAARDTSAETPVPLREPDQTPAPVETKPAAFSLWRR